MNNKDELYHYGVKGMKWKGHVYATREELNNAKKQYKQTLKENKKIAQYEYASTKPVRSLIGGYLKGGLGGTAISALATAPFVLTGKMSINAMSKATSYGSYLGSIYGVGSRIHRITKGKQSLNNKTASDILKPYSVDESPKKNNSPMDEKHRRGQRGNI